MFEGEGNMGGFCLIDFHTPFFEPLLNLSRAVCNLCLAITGSAWAARTAVSSAKLAVSVSAIASKSAV